MNEPVSWTVVLGKTAAKQLDRIPGHDADAIRAALKVLARDPLDRRANPNAAQLTSTGMTGASASEITACSTTSTPCSATFLLVTSPAAQRRPTRSGARPSAL